MASTFTAMSSVGSLAALSCRVRDKKFSSSASISSCSFVRRQNVISHRNHSPKICAMAKELHFNKDGSAIKKLQVSLWPRHCWVLIY
jgi:chaperonin GroEL